ncbi:hypothetical protein QZM66_23240 [Burkholderia contaminans]|uniref:hypothetical protein n=1 Tax=Burkholderia contaminans TaxID=488447 RepID=UPI00264B7604|nr:hypothetical protein [Burkholderia contaminans]MDN7790484.1 hypothetical protein [Burkholderia contaminans]
MLKYNCGSLSKASNTSLASLQAKVDACATHADKYNLANKLFSSKTAAVWGRIRAKLGAVSPPGDACFYCERDRYRDIEHVRPKRHYPESCFVWGNYLYACTICNQDRKKDKYAVFDANDNVVEFDRSLPITSPVPVGDHVLIDLRLENPMDFLKLDLDTGRFVPIGNAKSRKRGKFTRDLFDLNESSLSRMRVQAVSAFRDYLSRYNVAFDAGDGPKSALILTEILKLPHPTVLAEMRRQQQQRPDLAPLFANVPAIVGQQFRP